MYRLSQITVLLLGLTINLFAQNPHGADFKMDCAACHTSAGWDITSDFWKNNKWGDSEIRSDERSLFYCKQCIYLLGQQYN